MLCRLGEVIVVVDVHTKHVKRPWLLLETAFCRRLTARGLQLQQSIEQAQSLRTYSRATAVTSHWDGQLTWLVQLWTQRMVEFVRFLQLIYNAWIHRRVTHLLPYGKHNEMAKQILQNLRVANIFVRWQHKYRPVPKRLVYKHSLEGQ